MHLSSLPVSGGSAWPQVKTGSASAPSPVTRNLNAHAPAFVPRTRAASTLQVHSSSSGIGGVSSVDVDHPRPAVVPDVSPCSTSGRPFLGGHLPACLRSFSTNSRDVRAFAVASTETALQEGLIVEFKTDTKEELALLQRPNGKSNWFVTDVRGHTYSLRPQQMVYTLPGRNYTEVDLNRIYEQALTDADASLLEDAWEMVHEEKELYSVTEMAELLFGNENPASCYASHRLLNQERIFFKQAGRNPPRFQARPSAEVNSMRVKRAAEAKAAALLQEFADEVVRCQELPEGEKPSKKHWKGHFLQRLQAIQAFALEAAEDAQTALALQSIKAWGKTGSVSTAVELLKGIGWWQPHEQLCLIKANRTESFPAAVQKQANELSTNPPPDPDAAHRQDLTHQTVVTIDDASTRDVDDGLAVETLPEGGHKLWVHIADPTRWVQQGDPLDLEAGSRGQTVYLPTGNMPMFPRNLADDLFSLTLGRPTAALSVYMTLNPDGSLDDCGLVASTVTPSKKLTYTEVDELLDVTVPDQEPELWALNEAAKIRERWREDQGALSFNMPEARVHVTDPHSAAAAVSVKASRQHREESASQRLVSEMMILAGEAVAAIGQQHELALPYRGQMEPILPEAEELLAVPEGPCRNVMLRSRMVRGQLTTEGPAPHAGLGLQGYVQFTSPIRRYVDMLAHFQLKAILRKRSPPFSASSLALQADTSSSLGSAAKSLEQEVTNYWLAYYFKAEQKQNVNRVWKALMLMWLRPESGLARILLTDLGLETVIRINRPAKPGEQLDVCVNLVDVPKGTYKFAEATAFQSRNSQNLDDVDGTLDVPDESADEVDDSADSEGFADTNAH